MNDLLYNINKAEKKKVFINGNVKKFCDKYGIKVCEYGIGWKVL